jgi:hypothetical protein
VVIIVIIALVADISLIRTSDLISGQTNSSWRIAAFIFIGSAYAICQYPLLRFIKKKEDEKDSRIIHKIPGLHTTIYAIVLAVQYTLIGILGFLISQISAISYYNTIAISLAIAISYTLSTIMMALLAYKFLSWFKSNKNSIVVLFYGLATSTLAFNTGLALILLGIISPSMPEKIGEHYGALPISFAPSPALSLLNDIFVLSSIISFLLTWISTILLLHHYSYRVGKASYWILSIIPLVFFLSQFVVLLSNSFETLLRADHILVSILLTIIYTLSKPIAGIMFGIAIWTTAKNIRHNKPIRDSMIISAYGIMLLFVSNQTLAYQILLAMPHPLSYMFGLDTIHASGIVLLSMPNQTVVFIPYPPFGLAASSFIGLASYLIFIGIYSSAIYVAQDTKLRRLIRKFTIKEAKLLNDIGTAQMQDEIQKRVSTMIKEKQDVIIQETMIQQPLDIDQIKESVDEVLREIRDNSRKKMEGKI